MGSSNQTPAQTSQVSSPWSGAQPFLSSMYGQAQNMRDENVGYTPYPGETQVPLNPDLASYLYQQQGLLSPLAGGASSVNQAIGLGQNLMSNYGMTPGMQAASTGLGQIASAANTTQNPYLQDILNTQGRQIQDRVASQMSGAGRYGSGQYTDVLTRALAESANPILAQDYEARQQRAGQAYQQMGQLAQQGGLAAGNWAQLEPTLQQAQLQPLQQLQDIGQIYQQRAQQQLQDQITLYNAQQAYPWEQLAREANILAGAGGLGGTKVTSSTPYQAPLSQRLLGGAAAGAGLGSIIPGVGTGLGALGGSLFGAFG